MSQEYTIPLLGKLPLAMRIRADLDRGVPTLIAEPEGSIALSYRECARNVAAELSQRPRNLELNLPQIQLQNL